MRYPESGTVLRSSTSFDGRPAQGRVEQTIVDGRTIFVRER
jgi:dihydroorotase-like cyclic amidohydrolase